MNNVRYYAFVVTMAEHMTQATEEQRGLRAKALGKLVDAVDVEHRARARCRDADADAATRVRSRW